MVLLVISNVLLWRKNKTLIEKMENQSFTLSQLDLKLMKVEKDSDSRFLNQPSNQKTTEYVVVHTQDETVLLDLENTNPAIDPMSSSHNPSVDSMVRSPKELAKNLQQDFSTLDQDGSKRLSPQETDLSPEEFKRLDVNGDGQVSNRDLKRIERFHQRAQDHAQRRDKADGVFPTSREEWGRSLREFAYVDQDGDNQVTEEEYANFLQEAWRERRRFDVDGNGKITVEEMGTSQIRFAYLDRDKDHVITDWEVRNALRNGRW